MKDTADREIIIRPEYDENGRVFYNLPNARTEENLVVVCPKVAEKVIPVIFLPGVMGSNLKKSGTVVKIWHADMYQGIDAIPWITQTPVDRKRLLNPEATEVDLTGKVLYNDLEGKVFPSREARGWGSALYKSYGESLHAMQCMLNDGHILLDNLINNTRRKTPRQLLIGEDLGAETGEEALTEDEVRQSYNFLFPVHVFGYNWLKSNVDSAKSLDLYIRKVLSTYHGRLAVNKVILVTHSMGGLVARHYSENLGGRDNILGIVHGVMPDSGSPSAYRRMKTGEKDLIIGPVIGSDAAHLMPVLAQSPGPLQLLPGKAYGSGWLKIDNRSGIIHKPESDPYTEIYLNESDWWRLCEKNLLLDDTAAEWEKYKDRIKRDVKNFIEGLHGKYHSNTYAFYGNSKKYPSDEYLVWQPVPALRPVSDVPVTVIYYLAPSYRDVQGERYRLLSSRSAGDGTVPARAGRLSFTGLRSLLATQVDHEGAFAAGDIDTAANALSPAMRFTLRSIIKMLREAEPCG